MVLAGTNAYTGNTTVAEGVLVVDGDISSSATTTVEAGGVLSGSGRVGDTIILAGGTGSPGSSPGTMTVDGNLIWNGGGNYNWQIHDALGTAGAPLGWDLYDVTGFLDLTALTLGSEFNINLWSLSGISPDASGDALNFNPGRNYTWVIVATDLGVVGFDEDYFNINVVRDERHRWLLQRPPRRRLRRARDRQQSRVDLHRRARAGHVGGSGVAGGGGGGHTPAAGVTLRG